MTRDPAEPRRRHVYSTDGQLYADIRDGDRHVVAVGQLDPLDVDVARIMHRKAIAQGRSVDVATVARRDAPPADPTAILDEDPAVEWWKDDDGYVHMRGTVRAARPAFTWLLTDDERRRELGLPVAGDPSSDPTSILDDKPCPLCLEMGVHLCPVRVELIDRIASALDIPAAVREANALPPFEPPTFTFDDLVRPSMARVAPLDANGIPCGPPVSVGISFIDPASPPTTEP